MGIINVTPDSFFEDSRMMGTPAQLPSREEIADKAMQMARRGASIIDIGGYSSRSGAAEVEPGQELERVKTGVEAVRAALPDILISVDTFRSEVAEAAIGRWGADIVNDISAGCSDPAMIQTVARLKAPYIMMHMRGTPETMQQLTDYPQGVVAGVAAELRERINEATLAGIADIIVDPGIGFSKTAGQNYQLIRDLELLSSLLDDRPMLIGVSRKSMIYKSLNITPAESLHGTCALNALALERGAAIIRVHDVEAAAQVAAVTGFTLDDRPLP